MSHGMPDVYILGCERYEMLRCCLASVCGFNPGCRVHVYDDASQGDRVDGLIRAYLDAGLVATYHRAERRMGVGVARRWVFDHFLGGSGEQLVQVEGDMLIGPGVIRALIEAYRACAAGWLCTHNHDWCHKIESRERVGVYEIGYVRSGSEPFWTMDRETAAATETLVLPSRPDLVPLLAQLYDDGDARPAVLLDPELQVQHLGAIGESFYYPQFQGDRVTYFNRDGSVRQPFPAWAPINFRAWADDYPACYTRLAGILEDRSPLSLPGGES